jgi:hydroxymethylpyrimidine/phosphomethylpyrimidine kinase
MNRQRPYCIAIGGFDPCGGAGVLADIKTFEQLKTQGLAVQTANTFQTEDEFVRCEWLSEEHITSQLGLLLGRYKVNFFKIGLIANSGVLLSVLKVIRRHSEKATVIWDPVLSATAGGDWNEERFRDSLGEILENVSIITPNIHEYRVLFGDMGPEEAAGRFGTGIYMKGGHSETKKGRDVFFGNEKQYPLNPKLKDVTEKHGTGCVLSSAITANLAHGFPLLKALHRSKEYVEQVMRSNSSLLGYHRR